MKSAKPKYPMQHTAAFGADLYVIYTMEEWKVFFKQLMLEKMVAVDTETQGFDWFNKHRIVGMSFGWRDTHFYIPVRHADSLTGGAQPKQLCMEELIGDLKQFFNRSDVSLLLHNAKFDRHFFKREGIEFNCLVHDTRTIWHFYNENAPGKLKVVASGWRDMMGRWHRGLVSKDARDNEKEIDVWRDKEAKARRQVFRDFLKEEAENLKHEMRYQGFTKAQIKAHLRHEVHKNHENNAKKEDIHYGMVPCEIMGQYAGLDTYYTWIIYEKCISYIRENSKLQKLYVNELKLQNVLFDAEENGIHVDVPYLRDLGVKYDERSNKMAKELKDLLWPHHRHVQQCLWLEMVESLEDDTKRAKVIAKGFADVPEINLNSSNQVGPAMQLAGVPLTDETDTGNLSLDAKVLKRHAHDPLVQRYQEYKKIVKLKTAFVDGILKNVVNGLVYPSFNPNVKTGRMSVRNPNVQQMPRGDEIRAAFVAPSNDYYYLLIDYSQIEVRLTAHFANDPLLIEAYMLQQDIHTRSGCEVFGYGYDEAVKVLKDPKHPDYKKVKFFRQCAKCVHPHTLINTVNHPTIGPNIRHIGSLDFKDQEGFKPAEHLAVQGPNGYVSVKETYNGGVKPLYHVVTNRGIVTCSENHTFSTKAGELVKSVDLLKGDVLSEAAPLLLPTGHRCVSIKWKPFTDCPEAELVVDKDWAYVAGAFLGDGSVRGNNWLSITHGQVAKKDLLDYSFKDWQNVLVEATKTIGLEPKERDKGVYLGSRSVLRLFTTLDLVDPDRSTDPNSQKSWKVPSWVFSLGREGLMQFLAGLFDTDGTVSKAGKLSVTTKSAIFAGQIASALGSLEMKYAVEATYNTTYEKYYYRINLNKCSSFEFKKYLRHQGKVKRLQPTKVNYQREPHKVMRVIYAGEMPCVDLHVDSADHLYSTNGVVTHNTINFAIIYGAGPKGLSEQIPVPDEYKGRPVEEWIAQCKRYIDAYLYKYVGVKRFVNKSSRFVRNNSYAVNYFGRVRHLPHARATKITKDRDMFWMEGSAQRQGTNFIVQGTAADVFKIAAVRIREILKGTKSRLVNFVHDEVQIYLHKDELHLVQPIKDAMEEFDFKVPLVAEVTYSDTSWAKKKDWDLFEFNDTSWNHWLVEANLEYGEQL